MTQQFEIAIVGGGPAGLASAIGAARMARRAVCIEAGTPRTAHAPSYRNYLGFPDGISGQDLLQLGRTQAERYGATLLHARVETIERTDGGFLLRSAAGDIEAAGVILATGIVDGQPSCGDLYSQTYSGVHYCVVCDGWEARGRRVAVIGHEDRARDVLHALRDFTKDLHLLLDGAELRMTESHREDLRRWGVTSRAARLVAHARADDGVTFDMADGKRETFPDVFVALGARPNTELAVALGCRLDAEGYIEVDWEGATSVEGVYAAGDCSGGHKQVTQAMAEGERAAIELAQRLRDR